MKFRSISSLFIFVLLSYIVAGCTEHYKTDYLKKFDSYLEYSIGDYKVITDETVEWRADPLPKSGTGRHWVLAFTDDRGNDREFSFYNYGYSHDGDSSNFGYAVMEYAMMLGKEQIKTDVLLQYFGLDEIETEEYEADDPQTSVNVKYDYPLNGDDDYARFVDADNGLRLKSIHPKQLVHDWEISFTFRFDTYVNGEEQKKQFNSKIEQVLREYMKYVDSKELQPVDVNYRSDDDRYHVTYDKDTDSFIWITREEYLESLRYIDGNLKEVDKLILNGKEYFAGNHYEDLKVTYFAGRVAYCPETEQYHIEKFEDLLPLFGIHVEYRDSSTEPYRWKVGGDTYVVSKMDGWSLKKNGGKNLLEYDGHECGGLSQSDFEMVSNTTVYMDRENEALVINSNE